VKTILVVLLTTVASAQEVHSPRLVAASVPLQEDLSQQLLTIKRVYVDRLTGGETAAQMRDLIISSLQSSKLFVLTENAERAVSAARRKI